VCGLHIIARQELGFALITYFGIPLLCASHHAQSALTWTWDTGLPVLFATALPLSRKQETRSEEERETKVGYILEKKRQKGPNRSESSAKIENVSRIGNRKRTGPREPESSRRGVKYDFWWRDGYWEER
jgi:hypothetical protein